MYNIVISLYTVMHNLRQFDPRPRMIPYFSHDALRGGRFNGRDPNIEEPAKELRQTMTKSEQPEGLRILIFILHGPPKYPKSRALIFSGVCGGCGGIRLMYLP